MEKTKSILSSKSKTIISTPQEVNQQIHYLRKLEEYYQINESLRDRVKLMEEELSKKNANRPIEADLTEVLNELLKKNMKLESELSKTVHRQNEALAEIKVRKETIKLARNERVIHSGIFKNIEKEIKNKQDMYKNFLINKRLQQLSRQKLQQQYIRKVKSLANKVSYLKKTITETKQKKEDAIISSQKEKECYIIRNSVLQPKTSLPIHPKESIHAVNHQNEMIDRILYEYALVEIQERKLLQLADKDTLEEVVEMMESIDNSEMMQRIEEMIEKIGGVEDELKEINRNVSIVEEREEQKEEEENGDFQIKKQLISKINREKQLINEMIKKAYAIAAQNNIPTQDMMDIEVFQAIESLVQKQSTNDFAVTTRSNDSAKLTQLLLKSKRSKEYQELISETKFKQLYSNLHTSPE